MHTCIGGSATFSKKKITRETGVLSQHLLEMLILEVLVGKPNFIKPQFENRTWWQED